MHKQVDRAIEDVGVIVPGIGEVFYIANPGEGVATTIAADECPTCPGLPEIQRDYDAFELKFNKRFVEQLVSSMQLHAQPAVRQLSRVSPAPMKSPAYRRT